MKANEGTDKSPALTPLMSRAFLCARIQLRSRYARFVDLVFSATFALLCASAFGFAVIACRATDSGADHRRIGLCWLLQQGLTQRRRGAQRSQRKTEAKELRCCSRHS